MEKENRLKIIFAFLFITIISSILTFSFAVFIIQIVLSFITLPMILKKDYKTAKLYTVIFSISLAFVFLVYISYQWLYGTPYYIGGSDDLNFENESRVIINSGMLNPAKILESGIIGMWHNSPFFVVYISILVKFSELFGSYSTFLPRIINVYYIIWICIIFQHLLVKYAKFNEKKSLISVAIFALTPNIQFINSHVFRDTLNLLQVMIVVLLFDKIMTNQKYGRKILYIAILAGIIYITYYTRVNSLTFAGALCLFILGEKFKINKKFIIISIIPVLFMSNFIDAINLDLFVKTYSNYVLELAGDGLSKVIFEQPLLPLGIFLRTFYAFITPFPNFLGLYKDPDMILLDSISFLIYIGVAVQILAIPFIIKRLIQLDWLSLSFLVLFLGVIATTFTFRHVLFYYPFMVAIGVDGYLSYKSNKRKLIIFSSATLGVSLALIYILLKIL